MGISAQPALSPSFRLRGMLHPVERHIPQDLGPLSCVSVKMEWGHWHCTPDQWAVAAARRRGGVSRGPAQEREHLYKSVPVKARCPGKRTWKTCGHQPGGSSGADPSEPDGISTGRAHLQGLGCGQQHPSPGQTQVWGDTLDSETKGNSFCSKSSFSWLVGLMRGLGRGRRPPFPCRWQLT